MTSYPKLITEDNSVSPLGSQLTTSLASTQQLRSAQTPTLLHTTSHSKKLLYTTGPSVAELGITLSEVIPHLEEMKLSLQPITLPITFTTKINSQPKSKTKKMLLITTDSINRMLDRALRTLDNWLMNLTKNTFNSSIRNDYPMIEYHQWSQVIKDLSFITTMCSQRPITHIRTMPLQTCHSMRSSRDTRETKATGLLVNASI